MYWRVFDVINFNRILEEFWLRMTSKRLCVFRDRLPLDKLKDEGSLPTVEIRSSVLTKLHNPQVSSEK